MLLCHAPRNATEAYMRVVPGNRPEAETLSDIAMLTEQTKHREAAKQESIEISIWQSAT